MKGIRHLILLALAGQLSAAEIEFQRQVITLAGGSSEEAWQRCHFADANGDGLADLLVLGHAENKLWVYRQRATGFVTVPDQAIDLPRQTAWMAVGDVDAQPGPELVISTSGGIGYLRQTDGAFETELRPLISAPQPFASGAPPFLVRLAAEKGTTNVVIPVITAGETIPYTRNAAFEWKPGPARPLRLSQTSWQTERAGWMLGGQSARSLQITQQFRTGPEDPRGETNAENAGIKKLLDELDKAHAHRFTEQVDLNGDGRPDLVVRRQTFELDPRTDLFVFLRGADNRLPERPTQVLHCSGFPIQTGTNQQFSAFCDLDGDGTRELLLVSARTVFTSSSGLLEMALSRGVDMVMNIRAFHRNGYALNPDATVEMKAMVAPTGGENLFVVDGDFNGDGRLDLLVRRSATEWDVYLSSTRGGWFRERSELKFEIPFEGRFTIEDLNGDGVSDLAVESWEDARLCVFLSRKPPVTK